MTAALLALALIAAEPEDGFNPLFNGKDLTGWKTSLRAGTANPFSVKDGAIDVAGKGARLLTDATYRDFELRLEFRFVEKASDSGVFFRMPGGGGGYQVQTKPHASVKGLAEIRGNKRDETFDRVHDIDRVKKAMKPVGDWQSYSIIARGPHAEVWLNGERVCTADGVKGLAAGSIGLQAEYGHLQFRNLRIKPLPPPESQP